jgi:hypothetical protein
MFRLAATALACAFTFTLGGCAPESPMPTRHEGGSQTLIDTAWNRALTPPDALPRQDLLDAIVGTDATKQGVDTYHMRSEKQTAVGLVRMEMTFHRARPTDDRLEITVTDNAGRVVRYERFSRQELDDTHRDLFQVPPAANPGDPPGLAAQHAAYTSRWEKITRLLAPE